MPISSANRAVGCMLGLAVGDALGYPVEFLPREAIPRSLRATLISDDTQLSLVVAAAVVNSDSVETFGGCLARGMMAWRVSPKNNRAPGGACMAGAGRLAAGAAWTLAGSSSARGSGAVMRVAPIGLGLRHLLDVQRWAWASSLPTHRHPAAIQAARAMARAVHQAFAGHSINEIVRSTIEFAEGADLTLDQTIGRYRKCLRAGPLEALSKVGIGDGWTSDEALMMALYVAGRHPDNFRAGVLEAVRIDGDSDTVGCLVGALLGARLGEQAIPQEWTDHLEHRADLELLAAQLLAKREAVLR